MLNTASAGISMRGAGYYSANTIGAKAVIDKAAALAHTAINDMTTLQAGPAFAIVDYGAADGGTSLDLIRVLITAIRDRAPARQITLAYTDLPHNDFSALFRLTQGLLGDPAQPPIANTPGLFISASGTSFYSQIFTDRSIDFGFSATAMHWLSRTPGPIRNAVQAVLASPAEQESFRAQAKADWETILLHRARELRPGGKLVLANFCIDAQGHYLGHTGGVNMFETFARLWHAQHTAGKITEAECQAAVFQQFYRTPAEFANPFNDAVSAVSQSGLRLDHLSTATTPCPYAARFAQDGDATGFARAYVPTLRSWSETVFMAALDRARPQAERAAIVDEFYASYEAEVAAHPAGHGMDYVHCFMTMSKDTA